jgi:hypothetical protein
MAVENNFGFKQNDREFNSQLLKKKVDEINEISELLYQNGTLVRSKDANAFVNSQNRNSLNPAFGAALTTEKNYEGMGALGGYMKEATNIMDSIYGATVEPTQKEKDINMGRMALKFFTQMGASASQPGQTALGAANVAGANVAQDYLNKIQSDRDKKEKLELAKKTGALTIASQLKSAQDAKEIASNKPQAIRTSTRGTQATYMKKEDATAYFGKFMKPTDPDFDRLVDSIAAPSEDMIGKPVVIGQAYQELLPIKLGNNIVGFQLSPSSAGGKPEEVETRANRRKVLNKFKSEVLSQTTELVPTIQDALDKLLYSDIQTGGLTELTMPFKSIMSQLFNTDMTELQGLEFLRSISYKLAPKMRAPGSGSTSDIEFKAYQQAILDIGNTPFANYLSLYSMKKMKENTIKQFFLEENLMEKGVSTTEINKQLLDIDTGIFTKFNILDADNKDLYNNEKERDDGISSWWSNLKPGTAIINRDSRGKKLFDVDDVFIVKGWENRGK